MDNTNFPLATSKQAVMKLDSALTDVKEIIEEDIPEEYKELLEQTSNCIIFAMTSIYRVVGDVTDEDEFINETIAMEAIDPWPGVQSEDTADLLNEEI